MKASVDTQGFDSKKPVGSNSKRIREVVDRLGDSSNKRLKVAVHTTLPPRCPKEETRTVDAAEGFSTSDKDCRAAMLKSRFADTIFKAQQEAKAVVSMQKMKSSVDTQAFDLKKSAGSTRPEAADHFGDSSKKRPKAVVQTTSIPQCLTIRKEEMRKGATRFSTSDKDLRVALLKSRFADTIFKAQQELKASVDTQGFDLKNSVGSKHRPETVNCVADKSKKRPKVAVHTTSTPRCPTILEEEMRTVDAARAERISTSGKDPRSAMLKSPFADPMLKDKAPQEMKAVKTLHPTPTIQQQREIVDVDAAEPKAHVDFKQQRDRDRRAAQIALEKMTNTAGIELNLDVQREFEILVGSSSRHY
ncbi:hypothetical protein V6N13_025095 [Hibiscus sabdariffa]|uniref:Uncharacterized protein n=2 Tax=Hibiscus sabdariffa TaxID=183260 RepID=A0ABR2AWH2_9ROSI